MFKENIINMFKIILEKCFKDFKYNNDLVINRLYIIVLNYFICIY